ncbi:MAG: hypothetical protein UV05_C0017G0023 [candidate division CPR1 bacterium GW2011_GWA2_42_17]|uniref:Uncharacterized protein n=1 Tax=candidate division CPR1 bacterium GW2011_GWA2_42_17 TaxID=1618341 RepID=A0A0G0Z5E1_9BACT|nr:MAG: hypothetical protein UV05_C0017G0023 [candidate division CPR1 bacterium GW2011_GWA2_42_17]
MSTEEYTFKKVEMAQIFDEAGQVLPITLSMVNPIGIVLPELLAREPIRAASGKAKEWPDEWGKKR